MKPHPYSQIFPQAYGEPFWELVVSIKKRGSLRNAVILYQDKILDGNQRVRACKEAGIKPTFKEFKGTDEEALQLVWDLNFSRRQLTPSGIATSLAKYRIQFNALAGCTSAENTPSVEKLAKGSGVSPRTVHYAEKVLRDGTKKEKKDLESGKAKAKPLAEKISKREKEAENGEICDLAGTKIPPAAMLYWKRRDEVKGILKQMRALKAELGKLVDGDPLYAYVHPSSIANRLNTEVIEPFSFAMPEYVCKNCDGIRVDSCKECKGAGVMNHFYWKTQAKKEDRVDDARPF